MQPRVEAAPRCEGKSRELQHGGLEAGRLGPPLVRRKGQAHAIDDDHHPPTNGSSRAHGMLVGRDKSFTSQL
eukprot:1523773-Pyramimonas_sp.AAC.1